MSSVLNGSLLVERTKHEVVHSIILVFTFPFCSGSRGLLSEHRSFDGREQNSFHLRPLSYIISRNKDIFLWFVLTWDLIPIGFVPQGDGVPIIKTVANILKDGVTFLNEFQWSGFLKKKKKDNDFDFSSLRAYLLLEPELPIFSIQYKSKMF